MTHCPRCNTDNPADALFCGECGARLALPAPPPMAEPTAAPEPPQPPELEPEWEPEAAVIAEPPAVATDTPANAPPDWEADSSLPSAPEPAPQESATSEPEATAPPVDTPLEPPLESPPEPWAAAKEAPEPPLPPPDSWGAFPHLPDPPPPAPNPWDAPPQDDAPSAPEEEMAQDAPEEPDAPPPLAYADMPDASEPLATDSIQPAAKRPWLLIVGGAIGVAALILLLWALLFQTGGSESNGPTEAATPAQTAETTASDDRTPRLLGAYAGHFADQDIVITITAPQPQTLVEAAGVARYANVVNGGKCSARLIPVKGGGVGGSTDNAVQFRQEPMPGEPPCEVDIPVRIDISQQAKGSGGLVQAMAVEWLSPDDGRVLMSGTLKRQEAAR